MLTASPPAEQDPVETVDLRNNSTPHHTGSGSTSTSGMSPESRESPEIGMVVTGDGVQVGKTLFISDVPEQMKFSSTVGHAGNVESNSGPLSGLVVSVDMRSALKGRQRHQLDAILGTLHVKKTLTASRIKRWWMAPFWPQHMADVRTSVVG